MHQSFSEALDQTRLNVAEVLDVNNRRIENAMRQNNQMMESEIRNLERRLNEDMHEIQSQLNMIESLVNNAAHNQAVLLEMAHEYGSTADMVIADIQENYRVEILCPGRLNHVLQVFQSYQSEIKDGSIIVD